MDEKEYEFFEHEGNIFRRQGSRGGVKWILRGEIWEEYHGDQTKPWAFGNRVENPLTTTEHRELVVRRRLGDDPRVWLGYDEFVNGKPTGAVVMGWTIHDGKIIYSYLEE